LINMHRAVSTTREALKVYAPKVVLDVVRSIKFRAEYNLVSGRPMTLSEEKSVVFFTTIKCASTYTGRAIRYLVQNCVDLRQVDLEHFVHACTDRDWPEYLHEHRETAFTPNGIFYGPFRRMFALPDLERYRIILMLRDPRDVIVSNYFSRAFSHPTPSNKARAKTFLKQRSDLQGRDINEYATGPYADQMLSIYSEYCEQLVRARDVQVLKYELFVEDFDAWLAQFCDCLQLPPSDTHIQALRDLRSAPAWLSGKKSTKENKYQHLRKATPGDFREKLSLESQALLNEKFANVLKTLNYELT